MEIGKRPGKFSNGPEIILRLRPDDIPSANLETLLPLLTPLVKKIIILHCKSRLFPVDKPITFCLGQRHSKERGSGGCWKMGGWSVPTARQGEIMSGGSTETNRGKSSSPRYYIKVLGKAIEIINAMGRLRAGARLSEIAEACRLDLATALRILHTLERHGWVAKDVRTKKFKLLVGSRQYRVGYAQLRGGLPFSDAVTQGLVEAARLALVELLPLDNEFDAEKAIEHARWMIREKVDFAIECQQHAKVAPILADMFAKARIPTLALEIPQPGALYFGTNNYTTGLIAGRSRRTLHGQEMAGRPRSGAAAGGVCCRSQCACPDCRIP